MKKKESADSLFKSKYYFSLKDAGNEVALSYGAKDKSIASAKLLGKLLCNTALFTGKMGIEVAKRLPDAVADKVNKKAG